MDDATYGTIKTNTAGGRLRKMLGSSNDIIVAPGVYDGFSARIALEVGYDCLYMVWATLCRSKTVLNPP